MLYIIYFKRVVYSVLARLYFKWIEEIFPQKSQITRTEITTDVFNNLYNEVGIAEIRDTMINYSQIEAMLKK